MADITMPQLGETVTEGTVTRWLKKVGEPVAQDEVLFEVSTDKVDSEVPSAASGYLAEILVQEGETVEVGARLAVISPQALNAAASPMAASVPPTNEPALTKTEEIASNAADNEPVGEQEAAREASATVGSPRAEPIHQAKSEEPRSNGDVAPNSTAGRGPARVLSPVVRRLLAEYEIDPADVAGSGAGGRVTRADVLGYVDEMRRTKTQMSSDRAFAAQMPAARPSDVAPPATYASAAPAASDSRTSAASTPASPGNANGAHGNRPGDRDEVLQFNNIRRRTAEHMVRSKATSAHTLVAMEVDFENVEGVRKQFKDRFRKEEGTSLTYLPFVARALVEAVREFPHVNSSVGEDALIIHRDLHLGIAVDLQSEGLIVPVIHNVDGKRIRAIARELTDLASRARSRRLSADDISGGTFTITNPGPFGTFLTVPIINQPQVAILSTDGVRRKPVVVTTERGEEAIAIHSLGMLALSFDHRAIDGAYAARFMARIKQVIETWDWSQEL